MDISVFSKKDIDEFVNKGGPEASKMISQMVKGDPKACVEV